MGQWESAAKIANLSDAPISQWSHFFLIVLPFLILGSRVSSDTTASFCAAFLAVFWFMNPQHLIRKQVWFKVFFVLWLFMCVTSFFTVDPKYIFIQSLIAIRWPAFALVLTCLIFTSENRLRLFERSALVAFLFIVLDSILQYCVGRDIFGHESQGLRLTGPFDKVMPGSYALRIYPIALIAFLCWSKKLPKVRFLILSMLLIMLSEIFSFLTGERIVFILFGVVNTTFLVALIYQEKLSYRIVLATLSAFVGLAIVVISLAPKMFVRTIVSFFNQLADFQHSSYYQVFHTAIILWEKSPWFGIGTRYFNRGCEALPLTMHPDEGCEVHPHNIYLEWLSQNGVIGLCLFLIVLFLIFRLLWRNLDFKHNLLESTVIYVAPIMVFWPFISSMSIQTNNYAGLVWLLMGWAMARALVTVKASNSTLQSNTVLEPEILSQSLKK